MSVKFHFLYLHLVTFLFFQTWRFAGSCTVLALEGPCVRASAEEDLSLGAGI